MFDDTGPTDNLYDGPDFVHAPEDEGDDDEGDQLTEVG